MDSFSLDRIRVFLAVVDHGSFSAAARKLKRAQSAVSYAITSLEAELGVKLFDRSEWKPSLTEPGSALLEDARKLVRSADSLAAKAKAMASGLEAELSVVVDVMFPIPLVTETAARFSEAFPAVPLRLHVEALGAVAQPVLDRKCRIGVMGSLPTSLEGLERIQLRHVELTPVASFSHPLGQLGQVIATEELQKHIQIVLTDRSELTATRSFGVLSANTWRVSDLAAKHAFLLGGLGWGYMPVPLIADDLDRGSLVRLELQYKLPNSGMLPMYGIYRSDQPPGPAGAWFFQKLSAHAV
jgi:DNA-binding transcriptional LysR family regulator